MRLSYNAQDLILDRHLELLDLLEALIEVALPLDRLVRLAVLALDRRRAAVSVSNPTHQISTHDVARFVPDAAPSSSLLLTQAYSTPAVSSASTGRCETTSIGVMFAARRSRPFSPFLSALTTSLTPRFSWRALLARLVVLNSFLDSFLPARGTAMAVMASRGTSNSVCY